MTLLLLAVLASPTSWVVVRDDQQVTMHGDISDIKLARKFLPELGPGYLWFRQGGKEYVVQDKKVLDEIDEAIQPQNELGSDQARLGKRQADLGQQQAKLGQRQAQLGMEMARSSMQGGRPDRAVEEEMQELSRAQETIGREQEKIGHEQEKMGHKQERLSRQVEQKVAALIDASLKNGTAREVR